MMRIRIDVNGKTRRRRVAPDETLLSFLRDRLRLTGAKEVCAEGECGACTVLLDGDPVTACLVLAAQADGRRVTTVEGLGDSERLHPVQEAFLDAAAVQCGYCIPGMLVTAKALLDRCPRPTRDQIGVAIAGNLCRCTGYVKIVTAIERAARMLDPEGHARSIEART